MIRVYLDFESYWADDFTLKKMTPVEYIQDPRFEALGCAFGIGDAPPFWVDGTDLPKFFKTMDWDKAFAVSHNALFDMLILSLRYGVVPAGYGCTLSMARNWLAHKLPSLSLGSVAEHYGMPAKWGTVNKLKGMGLAAIKQLPDLYNEMAGYACDDTIKCRSIFANIMGEGFPAGELEVVDMLIRMATEPKFELDTMILAEHLAAVQAHKQSLLDACYVDSGDVKSLMSDQQLAVKLLFLGVDIPMKVSKTTGKQAYAFAKSDKQFTALLEDENPMVQALVAARLGHKSTLEETRTTRLLSIANCTEQLPVPLKYSGAHTHRFSGDWKINLQNLTRGGKMRFALKAPKGKKVVAIDASQIEARFNAEMAGETKLVKAFEEGRDVYAEFAREIYGYEVNKKDHPRERFVGKTGILSLGYGSSWPVFQNMCRLQGGVDISDSESARVVKLYRTMYPNIAANWQHANSNILPRIARGGAESDRIAEQFTNARPSTAWGPVTVHQQALELPNGNFLRYHELHQEVVDGKVQWMFMRGNQPTKIYGAKLVENVIQALAFICIMDAAKRVKQITRGLLLPAHQVHDELIYIVEERHVDWVKQMVAQEMSRRPEWMPNVPLAAEAHSGDSYGEAK